MRPKWAFQLLPNTRDVLGKGFRVDEATQVLENEVNRILQCKFNFHGISKLVVRLGPKEDQKRYHEHISVATVHYPNFDANDYNELSSDEKTAHMKKIIYEVFDWLINNFDDAECFKNAKKELDWQL